MLPGHMLPRILQCKRLSDEQGEPYGCSQHAVCEGAHGDILLIGNAGAYGRVMSSNYNMRPPAEEYFLRR